MTQETIRYIMHAEMGRASPNDKPAWMPVNMLVRLYGLELSNWVEYPDNGFLRRYFKSTPGDIHLWPRADGDYTKMEDGVRPEFEYEWKHHE